MRLLTTTITVVLISASLAHAQGREVLDAGEIMRKAAAHRAEIRRSAGTFSATLRTTSSINIDNGSSRLSLIPEGEIVNESIGSYYWQEGVGGEVTIQSSRGTPVKSGLARSIVENYQGLGDYFSVSDDEIILLNTAIASPLAEDAERFYDFALVGTPTRGGIAVYEIDVRPASRLYPLFEGKIWITRASNDVMEIDLAPSRETAIPFIRELHFIEKFSPIPGAGYLPESLELIGRGEVMAAAFGLAKSDVSFKFTSTLSERRVNVPRPDSILFNPTPVVVRDDVGASGAAGRTGRGALASRQAEGAESGRGIARATGLAFSGLPYLDYNRAGATSLGVTASAATGPLNLSGTGAYSFGLKRPIGDATLALALGDDEPFGVTLRGSAFSHIATTTTGDKTYPRVMNTLVAMSLHQDYYDYYRKDGWSAGADLSYDNLSLSTTYERSQQFSLGNNASWALLTWKSQEFQKNPAITDGSYQTLLAELAWGRVTPFLKVTPVEGVDIRWSLSGLLGSKLRDGERFRLAEGLLSVSLPVVRTGYNPMTLTLLGAGGIGSETLPPQYQFRLRTSAATFGKPGGLVSPKKGLYGGTEYIALGGEFNLTDLPWRALGLPTYNGRGIDLIVGGGGARYIQRHETGYLGMGDLWYTEAGVALSRIPLFITDLLTGRVDVRWGLGPLGQVGANFTFVAPF